MNERGRAAGIIARVVMEGRSLSDALPAGLRGVRDPRQRALVQELAFGTLRWYYRLDALLERLLNKPLKQRDADVRCLLLAGLYQLTRMAVPAHAAVSETVQAARALHKPWASGLVNAVLRNYQRQAAELERVVAASPAALHAHPAWLVDQLRTDWPQDWEAILRAGNQRPPFSLRVNRRLVAREDYLELLGRHEISARALAFASHGIALDAPRPVDALPGFDTGQVSVQDGAAQQAAGLLDLSAGQRVLDACAAPGGKTAHILESEPELSSLTAIDISENRVRLIEENLSRLGLSACVMQADAAHPAAWWDGQAFDRILLDVPCSATGVIRRHPDIKLLRRPEDIRALAVRQAQLLHAMWPLLSAGGMLLYTTCSVLAEENERQIERFLSAHPAAGTVASNVTWGRSLTHGRQILPGEHDMDGFYFACMRKA